MGAGWMALLAAFVGAGGAVAAQIAASIFAAKRETERFDREEADKRNEWQEERDRNSWAMRRDLYVRYLDMFGEYVQELSIKKMPEPKDDYRAYVESLPPFTGEFRRRADRLRTEINLLAPEEVTEKTEDFWGKFVGAIVFLSNPDVFAYERRKSTVKIPLDSWLECREAMRADLLRTPPAADGSRKAE